ncbi:MAG: flagellar hook-associated protein 3 [Gammaproteobacteria bacterium]|nr:flagellar hook-associated protein 3 [Gammaproteobacteria bacterium]
MLDLQKDVQKYQTQISSGKRILNPADDPSAAAQSVQLTERIGALTQYDRNANLANLRLSEQETAVEATQNALQRVRELVLRAKNRSLATADRRFIAAEVGERLNEIQLLANKKNSSGEYIFAGTAADTLPFAPDITGTMLYAGNDTVRALEIAEGRTIGEGLAGSDVFMGIRNGNGTFVTGLGAANTGTGRPINDRVTDLTAFTTDNFRIVFTAANTYDVVNDTSGATILSAQSYVDGSAISFNGNSLAITGVPNVADEFTLGPARNQSVIATISRAQRDMSVDITSAELGAESAFNLDRALGDIDLALDSLGSMRAQIGARQNALDSQISINTDVSLQLQSVKSKLEDVDIADAISRLSRQTQALEAAQQAFIRIQGLSLFNYLG